MSGDLSTWNDGTAKQAILDFVGRAQHDAVGRHRDHGQYASSLG
jgi:hypothetical protein